MNDRGKPYINIPKCMINGNTHFIKYSSGGVIHHMPNISFNALNEAIKKAVDENKIDLIYLNDLRVVYHKPVEYEDMLEMIDYYLKLKDKTVCTQ